MSVVPALRDLPRGDRDSVIRAMRWYYGEKLDLIAARFGMTGENVRRITGSHTDRHSPHEHPAWTPKAIAASVPVMGDRPSWSVPGPALVAEAHKARAEIEDALRRGIRR